MTTFSIRPESQGDGDAIHALTAAAFGKDDEARLVDMLRASGDSVISLVAADGGNIVGHVLFSKMQTPARTLGLGPVSVAPGRQKQGIGSALIRAGLEQAKAEGWQAVFVLGNPVYYTRFGFRVEAAAKFSTPYPKQYFMAQELVPGALASMSGAADYAAAFGQL